jgi:hypothetical protein
VLPQRVQAALGETQTVYIGPDLQRDLRDRAGAVWLPSVRDGRTLGQVVVRALLRHIEAFPPAEVELDDETDPSRPLRRKVLLLFTDARGNPLNRDSSTPSCGVRPATVP